MIACVCARVTVKEVLRVAEDLEDPLDYLGMTLGVAQRCGRCREFIEETIKAYRNE